MGYIQNVLLNGKMEILDGDEQVWTMTQQIANIVLWLIVIAALTVLSTVLQETAVLICTCRIPCPVRFLPRCRCEQIWGQNVLVFVLDRFDSSWMETVYEEDAAIS